MYGVSKSSQQVQHGASLELCMWNSSSCVQMMEGGAPGMAGADSDNEAAEQQLQLRRDLLLGHFILQSLQPASAAAGEAAGAVAAVAGDLEQQGLLPRCMPPCS